MMIVNNRWWWALVGGRNGLCLKFIYNSIKINQSNNTSSMASNVSLKFIKISHYIIFNTLNKIGFN